MNYQYIKIPNEVSIKEIENNNYCLAPSKYSAFRPNTDIDFLPLSSLVQLSSSKKEVKKNERYFYSEIGDIEVNTGEVNGSFLMGINVPSKKPKLVKEGDILISNIRTYRGGVGFVSYNENNHICSPALTVIRNVDSNITKEYLFAVLRTNFFIEQVLGFQNRGMYPRLDKSAMDNILIPIPKSKKVINYITILCKSYINKTKQIKEKHQKIIQLIETELTNNQSIKTPYQFKYPTIKDIEDIGRLDTGLYSKTYQKTMFLIKNYKYGAKTIYEIGFNLSRGQNLQVSNIGISIYSDIKYQRFYTLVLPTNISDFGTVNKLVYLGSNEKLKTLNKGEVVFGAEATFRSFVVCDNQDNIITNIHGVTLFNKDFNKSIFIKCFLDFLVSKGVINCIKVGGNGGSFAQKYWEYILFPLFPINEQNQIFNLYHNKDIKYNSTNWNLDNFLTKDNQFNEIAGIYELDKTAKYLKDKLNLAIDDIIKDKIVEIKF